jgi:hypothetical protein
MQTAFHDVPNNDKIKVGIQKHRKKRQEKSKRLNKPDLHARQQVNICGNFSCRMRKAGCRGFEGCPGYLAK